MMRNLMITIAYKGTAYRGFQVQKNLPTVCAAFQDAVETVFGTRYDIKGCSRTDSGVHARGFVLSLKCRETIPCDNIIRALNVNLPMDIVVLDCREAPEDFHPRYDSVGKRYLYRIWNSRERNPFEEGLALHVPRPLDLERMNAAARRLEGTWDYSAFCSAGDSVEDHVRTVYRCRAAREGNLITLSVTGDGFLYNMVRIITGTLLEVCAGRRQPEEMEPLLLSRDRTLAGKTASPWGLYLDRVFYSREELTQALMEEARGKA